MSILRLAIVVLITAVVSNATLAQECAPCNTCGLSNNNKKCLTADELWAGFADSQCCKGCVKMNKFRPQIDGLGGLIYCGEGRCAHRYSLRVPFPTISLNRRGNCVEKECQKCDDDAAPPQPQVAPEAPEVTPEPQSDAQTSKSRPFRFFGANSKQVVDQFGKLGESRSGIKFSTITIPKIQVPIVKRSGRKLPSAINGSAAVAPAMYVYDDVPGPPKPVVESEDFDRVARHIESDK